MKPQIILDGAGKQRVGDVKLPAHPESFQLETNGRRIFVNVPDAVFRRVVSEAL